MAGITMAGSGSGLDLETIITTFVTAEKTPKETRLNKKEVDLTTELSGIGTLKSGLADFKVITGQLGNVDSFYQSKTNIHYQGRNIEQTTAGGGDSAALPITIKTKGVVPKGAFDVEVKQLAQGARLESDFLPARETKPGQGMLYFDAGKDTFQVNVNINDTLQNIQKKINDAPDNYGISANVISSDLGAKIVYTSEKSGKANDLSVFTSDSSLNIISSSMSGQPATDAIITVDGNTITKDTNVFNHAVSGVTITANSLTKLNEPAKFSTSTDHAAVQELIYGFVDGYNTLMDSINVLTNPETGVLKYDSSARSIKQQLQNITGSVVSDASKKLNTLYGAGISLEEGGMLAVNPFGMNGSKSGSQRLNDAVNDSLDDLGKLFAGDNGIAAQVNSVLTNNLGNKGMISQQENMLSENLRDIGDDRAKLDRYVSSFENTLRKKYTALDNTVSRYNATGDYIRNVLG